MPASQYRSQHSSRRPSQPVSTDRDYQHHNRGNDDPSRWAQKSYYQQGEQSHRHRHSNYPQEHRQGQHRRPHHNLPGADHPGSWRPRTYGTYIWPLETRGPYDTMDPTKCRCTCCPHPSSICRDQQDHHHPPKEAYTPTPGFREYDSIRRADSARHSSSQHSLNQRNPRSSRSRGEFVIGVVDNSTGPLRHEHGRHYPLALSTDSSVASVVSFLTPDKRRAKVIVHWADGEDEPFDDKVPMGEVRCHAKYLEVREKKVVRWA